MKRALVLGACLALVPLAIVNPSAHAGEACAPADVAGGEWRTFGPDLDNNRSQPAESTIGPTEAITLAPVWTFGVSANDGSGAITGTPVIADGCAYVASDGGDVYALNADTGAVVWHVKTPSGGGINSSLAVVDGVVHGNVSRVGSPYSIALDQATGTLKWQTQLDEQVGSDSYSSAVVYDGIVFAGVSGGSAELGDEADRYAFQGSYVLLDAVDGAVLHKEWTVHDPALGDDGFAGGGVWSTAAVDVTTGFAYVGTANPFQPREEHAHTNAIVKVDLNRDSADFGKIVASYKGVVDEYFPELGQVPCQDIDGNPPPWYPQGAGACQDIDLDFGAAPNIFTHSDGRTLVGDGQKAGVYHAVDPVTMEGVWKQIVGPPGAVGGIVGTATVTGTGIAGPITPGGYLWSIAPDDGALQWAAPVADGAHWGQQTSSANGVVYTMDLKGFLDAYDATTGAPVLHRPMPLGSSADVTAGGLGGGVAIARNTVYAPGNGFLLAFRPGAADGGPGGLPGGPGSLDGAGPMIVSGPGGFATGYVTPAMIAQQGGTLTYANADVAQHNVVAAQSGPAGQPWCGGFGSGKCPIFWSELIGVGKTTPVLGLDNVLPGATYDFYCTIHPNMQGTLVVQP